MKEPNRIPETINDAIELLFENIEDEDRAFIHEHEPITAHHSFGQSIRNIWKLWDVQSPLVKDFVKKFELFGHADDISSIILTGFWAKVKGEDYQEAINKEVIFLKNYWIEQGFDILTGLKK